VISVTNFLLLNFAVLMPSNGPAGWGRAMHGNPQTVAALRVHELRREGGRWLREQRERANLSQRQLAAKVGAEYYTLISQLETGRGRVAPDDYDLWAEALNISRQELARTMMRFYDPVTYNILFEDTASAGKH
jgi:DNA-binding XRE family transcriptional regulator